MVKFFCVFHPFLNSPQNASYFECRHMGSKRKLPTQEALSPKISHWRKTSLGALGGLERGEGQHSNRPPPLACALSTQRMCVRGPHDSQSRTKP